MSLFNAEMDLTLCNPNHLSSHLLTVDLPGLDIRVDLPSVDAALGFSGPPLLARKLLAVLILTLFSLSSESDIRFAIKDSQTHSSSTGFWNLRPEGKLQA